MLIVACIGDRGLRTEERRASESEKHCIGSEFLSVCVWGVDGVRVAVCCVACFDPSLLVSLVIVCQQSMTGVMKFI